MSTPPPSSRRDLIAAVAATMRTFMAHAVLFQDAVAKSVGLNSTDLQCANLLLLRGSATPGELAEWSGLTAGGAITSVVDRLERAGLVRRSRDTVDRRRVVVLPETRELWQRVGPKYVGVAEQWNAYLDTLTDDQIAFADAFLRRATEINAEQIEWLRRTAGP